MKLKINNEALAALHGAEVGDVLTVGSIGGTPTNREWRNRVKDAATDNCVTVVSGGAKSATKTTKKEGK